MSFQESSPTLTLISSKVSIMSPNTYTYLNFYLLEKHHLEKKIVKIAILRVDLCINININYFWEYLHKMLCAHVSFYKISYI